MLISSGKLNQMLPIAEDLVRKMGKYALSQWGKTSYRQKGSSGDIITDTDIYIENKLRENLPKILDVPMVGEEEGGSQLNEIFWVIDPIDGTKHFAHFMPSFFTQIALVVNQKPLLGIVYDPVTDQMFSGAQGCGAMLNGRKLSMQRPVLLSNAIIDVDFGGQKDFEWKSKVVKKLSEKVYRVRISAGRFSPYLLTGGINIYLVINPTTKIWDQLPKLILFQEAGYTVLEFDRDGITNRIIGEKNLVNAVNNLIN